MNLFKGYELSPVGIDCICFSNKLSIQEAYCYGMVEGYEDRVTIQNFILCDEYDTMPVEFLRLLDKIQALLDSTREG